MGTLWGRVVLAAQLMLVALLALLGLVAQPALPKYIRQVGLKVVVVVVVRGGPPQRAEVFGNCLGWLC